MAYIRTEVVKTGAARIGRSGKKLHPARIVRIVTDERTFENQLTFGCSCTGTANGHALNKSQFLENVTSTCRG